MFITILSSEHWDLANYFYSYIIDEKTYAEDKLTCPEAYSHFVTKQESYSGLLTPA